MELVVSASRSNILFRGYGSTGKAEGCKTRTVVRRKAIRLASTIRDVATEIMAVGLRVEVVESRDAKTGCRWLS